MEYSIINYSQIITDDSSLRIDAEHYKSEYFRIKKLLIQNKSQELLNFIDRPVMTGHTPSMKNDKFYSGNINFIKTDNLREHYIEGEFTHKLSEEGNKKIKRSSLKENDVLVTIIGATFQIVGRACLVKKKDLPANINQNIALIRASKKFSPEYLTIYLNSYYGRNYLWYLSRQTEQVNLNCREVEKLLVPTLSDSLTKSLIELHRKAYSLYEKADELFQQAEQILLSELNLLGWKPKHRLSFVKHYSDTESADRIDAEYFQPMYGEIVKAIASSKDYSGLGDLVSIKKCIEPGSEAYQDSGVMFLRVSNLSKFGFKDGNQQYLSTELYQTLKQHQPKKGEILLSKDATPGIAYYLKDEPPKLVPSGGILRLKVKDEDKLYPEYLTLVLNSVLVQKQIERDAGGSIINHWLVDQVKNTLIPILPDGKQKKIAETVNDSFCNRELSKRLLDIAKRGVELAIEKDEKQAQKWIDSELKELSTYDKRQSETKGKRT